MKSVDGGNKTDEQNKLHRQVSPSRTEGTMKESGSERGWKSRWKRPVSLRVRTLEGLEQSDAEVQNKETEIFGKGIRGTTMKMLAVTTEES